MIRSLFNAAILAVMLTLSGCATNIYPGGPTPSGLLISNTRATASHLAIDTDASASRDKVGEASAGSFLGLFGFGDSSVTTAMNMAGISKVHHVDYQNTSFLMGLFFKTTTFVYGE